MAPERAPPEVVATKGVISGKRQASDPRASATSCAPVNVPCRTTRRPLRAASLARISHRSGAVADPEPDPPPPPLATATPSRFRRLAAAKPRQIVDEAPLRDLSL
jgi:hypothetical protein